MGKFEQGQWVRRTSGSSFTTSAGRHGEGFVGQIKEVVAKGWDELIFTNGHRGIADGYEAWQPKVGDRVRFKTDEPRLGAHYSADGLTVTKLREIDEDGEMRADVDYDSEVFSQIVIVSDLEPLSGSIAPLSIEAGKFYKTRDGKKVGPMSADAWVYGPEWKFTVDHEFKSSTGKAWRSDGTFSTLIDRQDDADLIAEWVDDEPAKASNDNAEPAKPKFKVGEKLVLARSFFGVARSGAMATVGPKGMYDSFVDILWDKDELSNGQWDGGYFPDYFDLAPAEPSNPAIVCLIENGQPKPSTFPHVHADEGAASKEAARLASVYKGQKFGVYVLTQTVSEEKVYAHEWQRLAIKGDKIPAIKALRELASLDLLSAKKAVEAFVEKAA